MQYIQPNKRKHIVQKGKSESGNISSLAIGNGNNMIHRALLTKNMPVKLPNDDTCMSVLFLLLL